MKAVDRFLARLDGIRDTGPGRWIAKCPAHDDRSPSLSVRELPDGRVLLNDFGGCDALEVLNALGLSLAALYPEPLTQEAWPSSRERFNPTDVLRCVEHEATIAAIVASDVAEGHAISPADADRAALAAGRIRAAVQALGE